MSRQPCDTFSLQEILHDDCDLAAQSDFELHLENCESCQSRLTQLAADEALWTQAASHLSTVDEIRLPQSLASRLHDSTTFVVPHSHSHESTVSTSFSVNTDWTRILDPPSHPEMLGRIDEFEIESKLGQGGMGIVLKGFDRQLNRAVAIKVLSPHLAINGSARKRFAREAESAAAVMHPNVVPIYSVNKSPTRPYIVMQLVPGHSLQSLVAENGPLDPKNVVRISMQVAAGLAAAHKQGLIHRDVKPANILIERDVSRVMITDFGLARAADDAGMTQTGWLAGTPHYMSPEQSKGDELDARTDLFSLGSLMYFIATGREPFRGDKPYVVIQKIISQPQTHPIEVNSDVPKPLAGIIEKLLEKDPKHRFQTADEVGEALEEYLAYLQQPNKVRPPKQILTARQKRQRTVMAGIGMAAIISVAGWLALGMLRADQPNQPAKAIASPAPTTSMTDVPNIASSPSASGTNPEPSAFSFFTDDQFSQELSQAFEDLSALEQSMRDSAPLRIQSFKFQDRFDGLLQLETELQSLEFGLRKENNPLVPENPMHFATPENPNDFPEKSTNPVQPPSQRKNDEE